MESSKSKLLLQEGVHGREWVWLLFVCSSIFHLSAVKIFTSAYALHILHHKYEFGPMDMTISILHPVHKSWRTHSKISTVHFSNNITLSSMNNSRNFKAPFRSHLWHTTLTRTHVTHIRSPQLMFSFVQCSLQTHHHHHHAWYITYWQPFYIQGIIYNFIYQYINNLLHTFFLYFIWWPNRHSTWTLPTHINLAQIILSMFYTLTYTVNHRFKTWYFLIVGTLDWLSLWYILIYVYVAVCRFCVVSCLIIMYFYLFSNYSTYAF
jgi:hypothetical protein